jgi:hypothetical protein
MNEATGNPSGVVIGYANLPDPIQMGGLQCDLRVTEFAPVAFPFSF